MAIRLERAEARRLTAMARSGPDPGETAGAFSSRLEAALRSAEALMAVADSPRWVRTAARLVAAVGEALERANGRATAPPSRRRGRSAP